MVFSANQHRFFHLTCYYLIWFACIYFAGQGQATTGLLISVSIFAVQIFWQYRIVKATRHLLALMIILVCCGTLIDSTLLWFNIFIYTDNVFSPYLAPPWMMMLWLELGLIIHALLQPLWNRPVLVGWCCFGGFPLAYLAGERFAAVTLVYGDWSVILTGLIWMGLLPAIMYYHQHKVFKC